MSFYDERDEIYDDEQFYSEYRIQREFEEDGYVGENDEQRINRYDEDFFEFH